MSEVTNENIAGANVISHKRMMAIELIIQHPEYIPIVKDKYLTDDILEYCLMEEPSVFRYIPDPSTRIINTALGLDGGNLKYIKKKVRKELPMESFIRALSSNPREALPYIPKNLLTEEMKAEIFDSSPEAIKESNIKIAQDDFLKSRIKENPQNIKFVIDPSDELKCIALREDPNIALYYDELTPAMMDIIDEKYPELKEVLPNYKR